MGQFVIRVKELSTDPRPLSFEIPVQWLKAELEGTDLSVPDGAPDGSLTLTVSLNSGDDVLIQGVAKATFLAPCARCLEGVPLDVTADMTTLLALRKSAAPPAEEDPDVSPEDLEREFYQGDTCVLDVLVRENLILEIPMQVHCTREECLAKWEPQSQERKRPSPFAALAQFRNHVRGNKPD